MFGFRIPPLAAVLTAALFASSCTVMESARDYQLDDYGVAMQNCSSALGSYSLPYATLTLKLTQYYHNNTRNPVGGLIVGLTPERHADSNHTYCLEFKNSPLSSDVVEVEYGKPGDVSKITEAADTNRKDSDRTPNGLLSVVISKNIDETGVIIRKIVRALFARLSGNASFNTQRTAVDKTKHYSDTVLEREFDPFNVEELAALNAALNQHGVCISMGDYTHARHLAGRAYCDRPHRAINEHRSRHLEILQKQQWLVKELPKGIYYRPRQTYPLYIYGKDDPSDPNQKWSLRKIEYVALENLSPIISIGVNRALFAQNRVILAFNEGTLSHYCISKGSEAQGAINIPIEIINGIVALPGETIKAQVDLISKKSDLLEAQKRLIDAQNKLIDHILAEEGTSFVGVSDLSNASAAGPPAGLGFESAAEDSSGASISNGFNAAAPGLGDFDTNAKISDFCKRIGGT